jgi:hypothetical protein
MRSVTRCYKQNKSKFYLVLRQSPVSKDMQREAEEPMTLKAVTRRQPVKMQQTVKIL